MYGYAVHFPAVKIRKIRHRGLRRFIENDDSRELRGDLVKRIRNVLAFSSLRRTSKAWVHRLAGACTSSRATAPGRGAFRFPATGASPSRSSAARSQIWTWRITTDGQHDREGGNEAA